MIPKRFLLLFTALFIVVSLSASNLWEDDNNSVMSEFIRNHEIDGILANGDSLNCNFIGRVLFGQCSGVAIQDTIAYACFGYSLLMFNISDQTNPVLYGYIDTDAGLMDIKISGSYAFVAGWNYGVMIFDISDPENVYQYDEFINNHYVRDIHIRGDTLYLAEYSHGVSIVDISDLTNPVLISSFDGMDEVYQVYPEDTLLYVAADNDGMYIYNIADPSSPSQISVYNTTGNARGVTLKDSFAIICDFSPGIVVLNISDPTTPSLVSTYDTPGGAYSMVYDDTIAYVADNGEGIRILNISDLTSLAEIGNYPVEDWVRNVMLDNTTLFTTSTTEGMVLLDVSSPASPSLLSTHYQGSSVTRVCVDDTLLFAAMEANGFAIINAVDPTNAYAVSYHDPGGNISDVYAQDNLLYTANSSLGLQIYSYADPLNPVLVGECNTGNWARTLKLWDDTLIFMANDTGGLKIINVANPALPVILGSCAVPGMAYAVCIQDTLAFVADRDNGFRVIDISDLTNPVEIGYNDPGTGLVYSVAVYDTFIFTAEHIAGLRTYSISDPANPVLLNTLNTEGYAYDVIVEWPQLYLADDTKGVHFYNISDPSDPIEIGYYDTYGTSYDLAFKDSIIFTADRAAGIVMFNYYSPTTFPLTGIVGLSDNPADSSGSIVYGLDFAEVCTTDASGYYEFADVFPDTYSFVYEHPGYIPDTLTVVFTGSETFDITLQYIPLYTLSGTVGLTDNPADSSGTIVEISELALFDTTDTSGDYSIDNVPAGTYTVVVTHTGYISDTINAVFSGTETFDTSLSRVTYSLAGVIGLLDNPADSSGSIVEISELALFDTTDTSGEYFIDGVPAGTYSIIVTHTGYITDTINAVFSGVEVFDTDLVRETFTLSGIIGLSDNPADSSGTEVYLEEWSLTDSTDASGYYEFTSLLPDSYNLFITHDGYYSDTIRAVFTGVETFDLTLIFDVSGIIDNNYMNKPIVADMETGNGMIKFTYNKKTDVMAHLNIYDLTGRNLYKTEINSPGAYKVSTATNLGRGVYFLVIEEPENRYKQKIVLIK